MKFKIFCVVIIALSLAGVLALVLKQNDMPKPVPTPAQQMVSSPQPDGESKVETHSQPEVIPPAQVVAEITPAPVKSMSENITTSPPVAQTTGLTPGSFSPVPTDPVELIKESVNRPNIFFGQSERDQVSAISLALNMNEEQELLLANYLQAKQKFKQNPVAENFATCLLYNCMQPSMQAGELAFPPALETLTALSDKLNHELTILKESKAAFMNELTKQQQKNFADLKVAQHL